MVTKQQAQKHYKEILEDKQTVKFYTPEQKEEHKTKIKTRGVTKTTDIKKTYIKQICIKKKI